METLRGRADLLSGLHNIETGKYSVQSANEFHLPASDKWKTQMDQQFVELLCEEAPEEADRGIVR